MRPFLLLVAVFSLYFLLISCIPPTAGSFPIKTGSLVISFSPYGIGNRTILPDIDMNIAGYVVTGEGPNGENFKVQTASTSIVVNKLIFGAWAVTVEAKNSDGIIIGSGTGNTTVHTGQSSLVSITVAPLDGYGSLDLTVSWNAGDTENPSIDATLIPAAGAAQPLAFIINGGNIGIYHNENVPTGYYTLVVKLLDNGLLTMGVVEVVRIVKGGVSIGTFSFSEINKPGGSIDVNITPAMADPLTVSMTGQVSELPQGDSMTVTATVAEIVGNVVYVWYVNGVRVDIGQTITLGDLAVGFYRLDVTAFSADGTRAGSTSAMFLVKSSATVVSIFNAVDLYNVRNRLNAHYIVMNDIDLSDYSGGEGWLPIGDNVNPFYGTFDGNNKSIRNLHINRPAQENVGLFGYTGSGAVIRNLTLIDTNIKGGNKIGGLTGTNLGELDNVSIKGRMAGSNLIAGLAGVNAVTGQIRNCSTDVEVTGTLTAIDEGPFSGNAGGLVGRNEGLVEFSSSRGTVKTDGFYGGGLFSNNTGIIRNCFSLADVTSMNIGSGYNEFGGLGSRNSTSGLVENCYATGDVSTVGSSSNQFGGLLGVNAGKVQKSFAKGNVTSDVGVAVGGLVGENQYGATIENCYATGDVLGLDIIGGLVGWNWSSLVSSCYATGMVSGTGLYHYGVGGLIGANFRISETDGGAVRNSLALNTTLARTSGDSTWFGKVIGNTVGADAYIGGLYSNIYSLSEMVLLNLGGTDRTGVDGKEKPLAEIMENGFYSAPIPATVDDPDGLGWDFSTVWKMDSAVSVYPILKWQN